MDELVKFFTSRIGLITILFLGCPGLVFVFIWNRDIFMEMDIIKLFIFSFAISFNIFIPSLFGFVIMRAIHTTKNLEKESNPTETGKMIEDILYNATIYTFLCLTFGSLIKLVYKQLNIIIYIYIVAGLLILLIIFSVIIMIMRSIK